ncbi:FAD/NAD(P)-binding protein [Paenarthrobacter sp. PH39-S1]|uniref:FAD/NAD(P)-binding protein n=1 Tax=Paenarthrobacter sp. PH39-S1 TaxID=3046204 RepID=UPI0024B9EE8A|nr:FAD/NAD(P)-binding protein [Paenarthrobacter sp. PH39-S1]MDJ0354790.1 FAD/NAD(P)-binding protein [Paenarthrobacter sp. PH39-S1]
MVDASRLRVVIVGAGPRGTSVLERLLARCALSPGGQPGLDIDLIDPYPAGPGHVWRTDQSPLYLMNTPSFFPTLIPDQAMSAVPLTGGSFDDWRRQQRSLPDSDLTAAETAELAALEADGFPSRALYGRYLRRTFAALLEHAPSGTTIRVHATSATRVRAAVRPVVSAGALPGAPEQTAAGQFVVELADGGALAADHVVLALGHLPARLNPHQQQLAASARKLGLRYWPPAVPNDVDWDEVPGGEPVLVRGMGLNFFDVVGQLTQGRGGRFEAIGEQPGEALNYLPSGREPLILAASRRGAPYRAKAALTTYYPQGVGLRFFTEEAVSALTAAGIQPGFDQDLWPLLHRDALWAYYCTLARSDDGAALRSGFLAELDTLLSHSTAAGSGWEGDVDALVARSVPAAFRLDLPGLARPFAGRSFASHAEFDDAMETYLQADARGSAAGETDPVKMAIGVLNAGRAVIKALVADGGITGESWLGGLRGWFEAFVEGLASGPPALRMEQLAALARAGVVRFVGPDPVFGVDPEDGTFTAISPWVKAEPLRARSLVEALAPANLVLMNRSPLLEGLLADGLVRPRIMIAADGEPVVTSGLEVTAPPYRPIGASGGRTEGLYVLGLQLSSVQWGTAIAAESRGKYRSGYRTLQDADLIAADILAS